MNASGGDTHDLVRSLLIASVREPDAPAEEAAGWRACASVGESAAAWDHLAGAAEHHGVAPLLEPVLAAASRTRPGCVPETARRTFAVLAARHRRASAVREAWIDRLLLAFDAAGLEVVLLKGAALAHCLYPRPGLRPMVDVDLLIHPRDAARAARCVERLGFVFDLEYGSRFARALHHLPAARLTDAGIPVAIELHLDTMSPDQSDSLTLAGLSGPLRRIARGAGPAGSALGHADMLRHLSRHAFEPATRIRLIHLLDLRLYGRRYRDEIDWRLIERRFPHVVVVQRLVEDLFQRAGEDRPASRSDIERAGFGMMPLSEIAASPMTAAEKLRALFDPPGWWMRGFYGVAPGRSLLMSRTVRHPATVARWLFRRGAARMGWTLPLPSFKRLAAHGKGGRR